MANVAVGYDNVDVAACAARGVAVTNTPGVLTDATAELAIALMLAAARRLGEGERLSGRGEPWAGGSTSCSGRGLRGATLGIVGYGGIGQAVAGARAGFGMEVVSTRAGAAAACRWSELLRARRTWCPCTVR